MSETRPDPDALLRRVQRDEAKRGRLKVFFGAAPGVGKTYAMLSAARAQRAAGKDVVIGWVETHRRVETAALAEGFERLPPREVEHRGVRLQEFDIDAAIARRPGLLLLDELAHSNAPGSRHPKRWQDARELLEAGIDVWTTLNVQHLESVNDLVERVTGVLVRETLPDRVLDEADEVEFVDLPPEDLLRRLEEGKVYLPDQAARAVKRFFRKGNLTALRELALRRTAEHVDADVQVYRRDHAIEATWPVAERVLVSIRPNPESGRLVRAARRLAARLRAEWIAVWVESPGQPPLSPAERSDLAAAFALAEQLGAKTATVSGPSVSEALLAFARQRNISTIVVGKPAHGRWRDRLRGSLVDAIVRASGDIDVFIVSGERAEAAAPARRPTLPLSARPLHYVWSGAVVVLCTLLCWAMVGRFDRSNLVMTYLLGVAFVASRLGRGPAAATAVLSVAAFDFFFVPPYLTFAVTDTQYVVTFAVMLVVSLLISTLAARVRAQADAARQREQRTQVLYAMSRDVAAARTVEEVAGVGSRHVSDVFGGPAAAFVPGPSGALRAAGGEAPGEGSRETAVAQWAFDHGQPAGLGTDTLPGAAAVYLPLRGTRAVLGVLGLRPDPSLLPLRPDQADLLEALARQIASGLERARLADEAQQARVAMESERLRSTLLSSVSHDLRTPLATITGAASSLLQGSSLGEEGRRDLEEAIYEEAGRLNRLVTNLLDMTRLESGSLQLNRDWHSLEELVGSALARLEPALKDRAVRVSIPVDLPLVPVDGVLVEQALVNLLENAAKYTEKEGAIRVAARAADGAVEVEVADEGPGLPPGTEERVFEKFYRADSAPRGFGLGLPICRAIVTAHGGRIWAERGEPRGTLFRFTLPLEPAPPPAAEDDGERTAG
ncbi:MAG TPA: sensor histidine kinase KdpD [Vicinamibacteria bacterium]|nr:sensor histidine kinase KdpD [Vicinamibacteria bacterium]